MDDQKTVFLAGEGDAYFRRNFEQNSRNHAMAMADTRHDPVIRALVDLRPKRILEVGASNGWRLDVARLTWNAHAFGTDPSRGAVEDGHERYPDVMLEVGTAENLPGRQFDCVIFGFCLYLCDRSDLFLIASEADRVLATGGYLIVYDFLPPVAYRNPYAHQPGVFSYKMDYSRLWSWHPSYALQSQETFSHDDTDDPDARLGVTVLKKG